MKPAFYLLAAAMIAVALGLLLLPLVRHGRRLARPRAAYATALAIAILLPLAAAALYLQVGTPVALNGVPHQPTTIDEAMDQLRTHLAEQPDDLQGWLLAAQTYAQTGKPAQAHDAYEHALKLDARNPDAMVGWAETTAMLDDQHRLDGRARDLLEQALKIDPSNQRGMWLLGISDFQAGRYAEASAVWHKLQPLLEPGSKVAQAVAAQIALADQRLGQDAPASAESAAGAAEPAGPALQVQVALAPALKARLAAGATLFVYARADQGPPMPLAVARLDASALPAQVTLTDAMAMAPQLKLSGAAKVFVGARISRSGQAIAQSGDLEGDAGVVATDSRDPIRILIDKVHP